VAGSPSVKITSTRATRPCDPSRSALGTRIVSAIATAEIRLPFAPNHRCRTRKRGRDRSRALLPGSFSTASHDPDDLSVGTGEVAISSSRSSACSRNQKYPYGPSVMKYGNCPIRGNSVGPKSSTGIMPSNRERSSSTNCALRERFATTSVRSSPNVRRKLTTLRFSG
jgi:hypothetical protein